MSELTLLALSQTNPQRTSPRSETSFPTNPNKAKVEVILRAAQKEAFTMEIKQTPLGQEQPVAADATTEGVEIFKFESVIDVVTKKEIQDMKDASAHQKRLKGKYPKLDGTPIHILEEIERLQDEFAEDGCDDYIEVSNECYGKLCLSKYGPWLNLTRLNFPRRKKGAKNAVREYIVVPLMNDGPFGNWKPYDTDASPELTSQTRYEEKKPVEEKMLYQRLDGSLVVVNSVIDRLEAFADAMNSPTPPTTPPPAGKRQESTASDSELSEAKSMESIEFDESFSSAGNSITPAPTFGTQPTTAELESSPTANSITPATTLSTQPVVPQLDSSPTIVVSVSPVASPASSSYKQESISPTPSLGNSRSRKTLSRTRKTCMHCGTIADLAWRNGPAISRNRCQNSACNKPRDH